MRRRRPPHEKNIYNRTFICSDVESPPPELTLLRFLSFVFDASLQFAASRNGQFSEAAAEHEGRPEIDGRGNSLRRSVRHRRRSSLHSLDSYSSFVFSSMRRFPSQSRCNIRLSAPPPPTHTHTHSADKFHIENGTIGGVSATCTPMNERVARANDRGGQGDSTASRAAEPSDVFYRGDAVVLATGHSARDVYYELQNAGVKLEAKGFAVGFRVEHPQVRSKI